MEEKKELGGMIQKFESPMVTQEGMQKNLSTFDLGGIVHSYEWSRFPTYGPLQMPNRNLILEGDMFSGDMLFKDGGSVSKDEREKDMAEIASIIEEYRDCMKRKSMCDATNKYAQSCVYKDKAMSCKKKASKLISKYREKYGRTESGDWMKFDDGGKVKKQEDAVGIAKEKLNESFALPIEMAVYVPSTQGANEKISNAEFRERIEETEKYLSSQFGGYSKVDIDGGYVSDEKGLIKEDVAKVVAFAQDEDFLTNRLPRLIKRITLWCEDWTQESIGFEIEGDLFYIDKNFEYDKEKFNHGGETQVFYTLIDEDGDEILSGASENKLIEYANTLFYYDIKDSGESEINSLDDAIEAFDTLDYQVKMKSISFGGGGSIAEGNYEMALSKAKEFKHHASEFQDALKKEKKIEAWVVAKAERASSDLSDITHYLDGKSEYADGGEVAVYNNRSGYQYDATNNRLVTQPFFTIKKGQLIKYNHSPSAQVEAKFLKKLGDKAKIEILSPYKPFTKRVDATEYLNVWGRTRPSNYLNEVERGTIKTVNVDNIEIVDEYYWRTWRKPISQYLKSPEFKEAFSYLDDEKNADGGKFGGGGSVVFRADDELLGIKHKKGDNFVDREKNRVTRKVQLLKDNPQVLAGGMPTKFSNGGEFMRGGVAGDIYSLQNPEQFNELITIYNDLADKTNLIKGYYLDHTDNSMVFLTAPNISDVGKDKIYSYVESLKKKGFSIINFEKTIDDKKYQNGLHWGIEKGTMIKQDGKEEKANPQWFKLYLISRIKYKNGGEFGGGGSVTKKLKRVVRKGKKYGNLAIKKAKPKAKKIVRKLKIGFDALAKKVAKSYEGKAVAPKYQKEYGKRYSKEEAKEVGNKVAAKVKRMKGM